MPEETDKNILKNELSESQCEDEVTNTLQIESAAPEEEKPKRRRRKKAEDEPLNKPPDNSLKSAEESPPDTENSQISEESEVESRILTIDAKGEADTEEYRADIIWHEIKHSFIKKRILSGMLGGIEKNEAGQYYAVTDYKGFRIVIPLKEMFTDFPNDLHGDEYKEAVKKYYKRLNSMLGAEIDFIVMGTDNENRIAVASRREAMFKKRQTFYFKTDENDMFMINEDRIVQARVIAVAEKSLLVEIFGVDCPMSVRDLSRDWIGDVREHYSIGDKILVRIKEISRESLKKLRVTVDVRSVTEDRISGLKLLRRQGKYAGKVVDTHKGVVFIRLSNGANAIAHSCLDRRMPGKKDDVSFVVTELDEERGVALGIITRIIKQNI